MSNNIGKLAGSGAKARVLPITRQNGGTRMNIVGRSEVRVDAFDKATGRTKYYDDLAPKDALLVRIKHSTIAHGFVKSVDISKAEKIPGVVKILTCFDVPDIPFPTAGHPWSMDPSHQDIADRHLLNRHVRYYGDDVCAVIAEDEVAAMQAVRAIEVEYEELPFVLDVQKAMEPGAPQLHEKFPNNILKHTTAAAGNYAEAIKEPGLIKVEGWYETPTVQHCHIENHGCFCYEENGRLVVTSSTQIPHIIRRVVGQAIGRPWGDIRVIKPYIGGGFGNKQDALYEPLCAYLSTVVGGRLVKLDCTREETFVCNRVRHAIRIHLVSWLHPDGSFTVINNGLPSETLPVGGSFTAKLSIPGAHNVLNALAAASVGLLMGETVENIRTGLASYTASGMRQNIYEQNGFRIYADCYNASPDAMEATLGVLGTMGDTGRRIAVLGSMLELGDYTEEGHRRAGRAAAEHADVLYAYGPSADAIARGAEEKGMTAVHAFTDQNELVEKLRADAKPGDALLFKGSRGMRMERALALFLGEEVE